MDEIIIGSMQVAQERIIKSLVNCGFILKDTISINKGRYVILVSSRKRILLTFKRDPFFTFGKQFAYLGKKDGESGDTINEEELNLAMKMQVTDIITVFSSGIAYTIPFYEFMEKAFQWTCAEGKIVKSISLKEYKKLFDLRR